MTREHTVAVKVKDGVGMVTHCVGHSYHIKVAPGEVATAWGNGDPITRAEFDSLLKPTEVFEIVEPAAAPEKVEE